MISLAFVEHTLDLLSRNGLPQSLGVLNHVFTRPVRGREFFEQVIRDTRSLDLSQPDRVQLIFGRRVYRNTPSRFRTQVVMRC